MRPTAIVYSTRLRGIWRRWVLWKRSDGQQEWRPDPATLGGDDE